MRLGVRPTHPRGVPPPRAVDLERNVPGQPEGQHGRAPGAHCDRRASLEPLLCIRRRRDRNPERAQHAPPGDMRRSWRNQHLRLLTPPRAPGLSTGDFQRDEAPLFVTSAPRGILNVNVLSDKPAFSLKFENWKVERPPWL